MNTTSNICHQTIANDIRNIEDREQGKVIKITFLSSLSTSSYIESIHLHKIRLTDPNFITFFGVRGAVETQITQHISQMNFSIDIVDNYDPKPVKQIEFI